MGYSNFFYYDKLHGFFKPEEFIQKVIKDYTQAYICHVINIEDDLSHVYPFQIAQISKTITQPIMLPEA